MDSKGTPAGPQAERSQAQLRGPGDTWPEVAAAGSEGPSPPSPWLGMCSRGLGRPAHPLALGGMDLEDLFHNEDPTGPSSDGTEVVRDTAPAA